MFFSGRNIMKLVLFFFLLVVECWGKEIFFVYRIWVFDLEVGYFNIFVIGFLNFIVVEEREISFF